MTGVSVGLHSQRQLLSILKTSHGAALSGATVAAVAAPGPLALVMAGLSIFSKEWLFRVTKVVGEKLNSPVVIANAWHHRSDAYSSILALLSIAWSMVRNEAFFGDAGFLYVCPNDTGFNSFRPVSQQPMLPLECWLQE